MKVNIKSLVEIEATRVIPSSDLGLLSKGIAGKTAVIEVDSAATLPAFIQLVKTALAIDPAISFSSIKVERHMYTLNSSKNLSDNGVADGSTLTVTFKRKI
jgi:hypothetical protein